jgi:AcrR family transcriptional regulator
MKQARRTQERGQRARDALVAAARTLFVEQGYFATGTEQVVAESGVGTRGSFYHHFESKLDLFRAVFDAIENELIASTASKVADSKQPLELLERGLLIFLEAAANNREFQRVVLIDGPAVLGWGEWRGVATADGITILTSALEGGMKARVIVRRPIAPLAHMLRGTVESAGLYIANAPDRAAARRETASALRTLLRGLRADR